MTATEENVKKKPVTARAFILWLTLALLSVLTVLSTFSAFLGARKATVFFNSPPLVVFWVLLTALFVAGFFAVKSLIKRPGLLLSHLGCTLVLLGAMWGSQAAHDWRARRPGALGIREGYMQIHEGHQESRVYSGDEENTLLGTLPFAVALDDFWIEYYEAKGRLHVSTADGEHADVESSAGKTADFGPGKPRLKILRTFENFKIMMEGGARTVEDAGGVGVNPALEVEITAPDGSKSQGYVFAISRGDHGFSYGGLQLTYQYGGAAGIKDYKSALAVLEEDEVVMRKVIEVNKPLHYGGFSFYQSSYDQENGHFTVLSVVSSDGLFAVFAGYFFLCAGVIWQCWLRHLKKRGAVKA